jgi:predicted urease superfamily metal-dependent hydrolase
MDFTKLPPGTIVKDGRGVEHKIIHAKDGFVIVESVAGGSRYLHHSNGRYVDDPSDEFTLLPPDDVPEQKLKQDNVFECWQ